MARAHKDGSTDGMAIVGFDKCAGLVMKDKNNELFDAPVNFKNGILEFTRPLIIPKAAVGDYDPFLNSGKWS